jgi:hypothetical protein
MTIQQRLSDLGAITCTRDGEQHVLFCDDAGNVSAVAIAALLDIPDMSGPGEDRLDGLLATALHGKHLATRNEYLRARSRS